MSIPETTSPSTRRPRTRWVYMMLAVTILLGVMGRIYLNPARYIPTIESALEDATGLSASIEGITIKPGSSMLITLTGITLGDGDLRIQTDRLELALLSWPLLGRNVHITSINPGNLICTITEDDTDAYENVFEVVNTLTTPKDPSGWDVSVDYVQLDAVRIHQGEHIAAEITASLHNTLEGNGNLEINTVLQRFGPEASFNSNWTWTPDENGVTYLRGQGEGSRLDATALHISNIPPSIVDFHFEAFDSTLESIHVKLSGLIDAESEPALDGSFDSTFHFADDLLTVSDISWEAPGVKLAADLTQSSNGTISAQIPIFTIAEQALDDLIGLASNAEIAMSSEQNARLEATDLAIVWEPGTIAQISKGRIIFSGIHTNLESGQALTRNMKGDLDIQDNIIHIRELKDSDINITGTITPDVSKETLALDLQGSATLHGGHISLFGSDAFVENITGQLALDRITGTFGATTGVPDDLVISGTLSNGTVTFLEKTELPPLLDLAAAFTTDKQSINTTIKGSTPKSGAAEVIGEYTFADHSWAGTVMFDLHAWIAPLITSDKVRYDYGPFLAQYQSPTFHVQAELPHSGLKKIELDLGTEGGAAAEAVVEIHQDTDGRWELGEVTATAEFPLDNMERIVLAELTGEGKATLKFRHSKKKFDVEADLTSCTVLAGEYLTKRPGDNLTLVFGGSTDDTWIFDTFNIDCLDVPIAFEFVDKHIRIPDMTVELASWQRLLSDDATAKGTAKWSFDGDSKEWSIKLNEAGITINEELAIDSATGSIMMRDDKLAFQDLHVLSAQSDFVLSAGMEDKGWSGSLRGSKIDATALLEFQKEFLAFRNPEAEEEELPSGGLPEEAPPGDTYWDKPFIGTFDIVLDTLYLGRGSVKNVNTTILAEPDAIRFSAFRLQPDAGKMTGEAVISPDEHGDSRFAVSLNMDQFSIKVLDDMFYEEPRGQYGILDGDLEFEGPLGDIKTMMEGGNGTATFKAVKGSFGKFGFASKILTALKTVNLINMRLPSLRDKGLTYKTYTGSIDMKDGVLQLQDHLLKDTSYALRIRGTLDYPQDEGNVVVFVRLLESISNLTKRIPIVRNITKMATNRMGVRLTFGGSAWDLQSKSVVEEAITELLDEIISEPIEPQDEITDNP